MTNLRQYSICDIQDEVRALVNRGTVRRQHRIYELSRYFSDRQWQRVESLLQQHEYLLRDCVVDLIGQESWLND